MNLYTEHVMDQFLDAFDDPASIFADIQNFIYDPDVSFKVKQEKLRDLLNKAFTDFMNASRFCLFRILCQRYRNDWAPGKPFTIFFEGESFPFSAISYESVGFIAGEESTRFIDLFIKIAEKGKGKNLTGKEKQLIADAWSTEKLVSRGDAFHLAHLLNFSVEEMRDFLLRAFDKDEGFDFSSSSDLIEYYSLACGLSSRETEQLKRTYRSEVKNIAKNNTNWGRTDGWTLKVRKELSSNLANKTDLSTSTDHFLKWLVQKAPNLDTTSFTSRRIFRALVLQIASNLKEPRPYLNLSECVAILRNWDGDNGTYDDKVDPIFLNGPSSFGQYKELVKGILDTIQRDQWRIPTAAQGQTTQNISDRVSSLLCGTKKVNKSDLLFMLWIYANLQWKSEADSHERFSRIIEFKDAAESLLEACMLPEFYCAHPLERAVLMSILLGDGVSIIPEDKDTASDNLEEGYADPLGVYEFLIGSLYDDNDKKKETPSIEKESEEHHSDDNDEEKGNTSQRKKSRAHHSKAFYDTVISFWKNTDGISKEQAALKYHVDDSAISYQLSDRIQRGISDWRWLAIGNHLRFGVYWQSGESGSNPSGIIWQVIAREEERALIISQECIEAMPYNSNFEKTSWGESAIRKWLNDSFWEEAFSCEEKSAILKKSISCMPNCCDKVFLLSYDELKEYMINRGINQTAEATEYVKKKYGLKKKDKTARWWLRTLDDSGKLAKYVDQNGTVQSISVAPPNVITIRPAMWVNIEAVSALIAKMPEDPRGE